MTEVNSNYFIRINQKVNTDHYNNYKMPFIQPIQTIKDLNTEYYELITKFIDSDGAVIIDTLNHEKDMVSKVKEWLEGLMGKIYYNSNHQQLPYATVKAEKNARYYINSNLAQPVHTDEGYTTMYPRYVALYCSKNAILGGISILVQFKPLYLLLKEKFEDSVGLLFKSNALTLEGAKGIKTKPLLMKLENNKIGISYTSILKSLKCDDKIFEMFDFISNYIHDVRNQIRFKLNPGQIMLFDNATVLHGRTRFASDDRLLYRFWFQSHSLEEIE